MELQKFSEKKKKIKIGVKLANPPTLKLSTGQIQAHLSPIFSIFVNNANTEYTQLIEFSNNLELALSFEIKSGSFLIGKLTKFELQNSTLINSLLPLPDINYVQNFANYLFNLLVPFVNNKYLKGMNLPNPLDIEGLYFSDLLAKIEDSFFSFGVTPSVNDEMKKKNGRGNF